MLFASSGIASFNLTLLLLGQSLLDLLCLLYIPSSTNDSYLHFHLDVLYTHLISAHSPPIQISFPKSEPIC